MMAFGSIWIIAIIWCFLQGSITLGNLLLGGTLGLLVFLVSAPFNGMKGSINCLKSIIQLIVSTMLELVASSSRVAWDILTPTVYARPRVVRIPVEDLNDVAITVLANAITLTPGSLALEVSDDRQYLYVHLMYAEDRDAAVRAIYLDLGNQVRSACGIREIES